MIKKLLFISIALSLVFSGCATFESIVKSTFPYTTILTITASSAPGKQHTAIGMATSLDQAFVKDGIDGNKVSEVRVISAKLRCAGPTYFNIGDLVSAKFYMADADGKDEVLVASRTDITADVNGSIILDIDNSNFLDKFMRIPSVRIRMVYVLRKNVAVDTNLKLILGLGTYPNY
jgi:hypothetical protein